jgi:peptidoglycan/LPS O-acetylase OafA/YrhL
LDGLRAFAILPVILNHCYPFEGWLSNIGKTGWIGVDLFFVISGYLITGILVDTVGRPHYYKNFIARRTLRIFPLYYVCLVLFVIATKFAHNTSLQKWGGATWFFFYLGNIRAAWVHGGPPVFSFAPLWSLQIEEQYYLLFPLAVALLSMQALRRFLIGCVVIAPLLRSYLTLFVPGSAESCFVLMPCRMDALALGGLLAVIGRFQPASLSTPTLKRFGPFVIGLAVAPALLGVDYASMFMRSVGYTLIDIGCVVLLAIVVSSPASKLAAVLRWRPLVYTGQIAYGLYLLHGPASWVGRGLIAHFTSANIKGHSTISVPITFIAAFIAASISWRFFELPILRLKQRFS